MPAHNNKDVLEACLNFEAALCVLIWSVEWAESKSHELEIGEPILSQAHKLICKGLPHS